MSYNPSVGRWMEQDPAGYIDGPNMYQFDDSDPVALLDPSGLDPVGSSIKGGHTVEGQGVFRWDISILDKDDVHFHATFVPDKTKCGCKHITFVQVVLENTVGGKDKYPDPQDYYKQFRIPGAMKVDHLKGEDDPFYGALWDGKNWAAEPGAVIGVGPDGITAEMNDTPNDAGARTGAGVDIRRFETFAVCIDTGEILGGIKWGFTVADSPNSEIELTGGMADDISDTPSKDWNDSLAKWNEIAKKNGWHTFEPKK